MWEIKGWVRSRGTIQMGERHLVLLMFIRFMCYAAFVCHGVGVLACPGKVFPCAITNSSHIIKLQSNESIQTLIDMVGKNPVSDARSAHQSWKEVTIYVSRHTFYLLGLTYQPVFPSYIRHPTTSVLWHFLWNHWRWCDLTQRVPNHHMNHNGPHEVKASALWAVLFCVWHMWT